MTKDKPYLPFEGGDPKQFDDLTREEGVRRISRVLMGLKMWDQLPITALGTEVLTSSKWVKANCSWLLDSMVTNFTVVKKGDMLVYVNDP